ALGESPAQTARSRDALTRIEAALKAHGVTRLDREAPEVGALAEVWLDVGEGGARATLVTALGVNDALQAAAQQVHTQDPTLSIWHGRMSLRDSDGPLQDVARLRRGATLMVRRGGQLFETSWGS